MKLIRGTPGSGKTRQVFREFKEALRRGEPGLRIVVPTATLVRHFQHELARDGVVISPRSVVSLNRFLIERAGEVRLVPEGLLRAIVRDCLARLPFPEFAAVAGTEGMTDTIVETIGLFENAGCTPDKLASVRGLGPLARPFEKLWRAAGDAVRQRGFQMRADWIRAAASSAQPSRVWMDGFLNFSPVEQEFLGAMAKTCDVTLAIADLPAAGEVHRLALSLGAQDQLLSARGRQPQETIVSAATLEREADEIARRIVDLHQRGTDFRKIGVAMRDAETYVPLLRGTFDRFGIPARFYFGSSLRKHPAAIFLGGLLSEAMSGWNFEATLNALRAHPRWGVRADFDRFDFAVREVMPGRGTAAFLNLCESEWLRGEISACFGIESWARISQKPADWIKRLESLAVSTWRPGRLDIPDTHTGVEAARSYVAGLRAWLTAVQSVAAFWANPNQAIPLAEFWSVASVAVDASGLHALDDRTNVVHVMDAWEARQWDVASLFICGMTDRDFPRRRAEHLLFPDVDIGCLRKAGIAIRTTSDYEHEEQWLLDSLRTRATESLVLTCPEHDASGKSMQRSRFIPFEQRAEPALPCRPASRVTSPVLRAPGRIASDGLQAEMRRLHQSISLTSLEDLAQCRFKFFSRRTLVLKPPPERPDKRLQPRVTGLIMHAALEDWLKENRSRDFLDVFEEAFDRICREQRIPAGYRVEVDRIFYRKIAQHISANDLWVSDDSQVEVPLTIEFPGGIQVNGRVDRIDRFGADCVIIDYKSKKTESVKKLVNSATSLQGPLYALAVREKLKLNPVAVIFWAVRDDERYGWGAVPNAPDESFQPIPDNWIADSKARTLERLSGFLGGQVHAHPEDSEQCVWCDYKAACRVEQPTLVQIGGARGD